MDEKGTQTNGLAIIKYSVDITKRKLEDIKKTKERLITAASYSTDTKRKTERQRNLGKFHSTGCRHGYEKEIWRKKLNLF